MAKKAKDERWTEGRIFDLLKGPFPDGAYVRIPGVRNGTGSQRQTRTADALIVSCWPSRGLWFAGVEIKVSLHDWKRELARPAKSAEIQQWCNYWYVAAPAGVVPLGEVPPTWGLIECGRGCKIVKAAPKLKAKPPDAAFVAAILRRSAEATVARCEVEPLIERRSAELQRYNAQQLEQLQKTVQEFREATGINIHDRWHYGDISKAIELVKKAKSSSLEYAAKSLRQYAESMVKGGCEILATCDAVLADPANVKLPSAVTVDDD